MDFDQLESSLSKDMAKDDVYWRENDAKFRAAGQNATYDEFVAIVKVSGRHVVRPTFPDSKRRMFQASHLKPLDEKERMGRVEAARGRKAILNSEAGAGTSGQEKMKLEMELSAKSGGGSMK